jgi:hypothetical protein
MEREKPVTVYLFPLLLAPGLLFGLLLLETGCSRIEHAQRTSQMKQVQEQRGQKLSRLQKEDIAALAARLESQSRKGIEPWNSLAYEEIVSRGETGAAELATLLSSPDQGSLLGLLAVMKANPKRYADMAPDFRVNVLLDALKKSIHFNVWGLPIGGWEDAGSALIGEGKKAESALYTLLKDDRAAPVWGSQGLREYREYQYRVKDYSLSLIYAIKHMPDELPESQAERDKLIDELLKGSPES